MSKPTTLERFKNLLKSQLDSIEYEQKEDMMFPNSCEIRYLFPYTNITFTKSCVPHRNFNELGLLPLHPLSSEERPDWQYSLNDIVISYEIGKDLDTFLTTELINKKNVEDEEHTIALLKTLLGEPNWKRE